LKSGLGKNTFYDENIIFYDLLPSYIEGAYRQLGCFGYSLNKKSGNTR